MPEPEHRLPTDTDNGMLLVISGPSGAGKTTITRAIERSIADAIFSVSATTRPRTGIDVNGVDYQFMSVDEFTRLLEAGAFLEHATYDDNHYGTLREPVVTQLGRGRLVILEIDVQGAIQVKKAMPEAFAIFVLPPSEQALLQRLRARKREPEPIIQRRFEIAKREMRQAHECGAYDAFIVNDDLEHAIAEALRLVRVRRG